MRITLPLPLKELSPNARVCWQAKSRSKKKYRAMAHAVALETIGRRAAPRWPKAVEQATFFFTTSHRRDPDNLLASLKSAFDGIADAGVVVNDRNLTHFPVLTAVDKKCPRVEIEVWPEVHG